jgi:hypothetical protein
MDEEVLLRAVKHDVVEGLRNDDGVLGLDEERLIANFGFLKDPESDDPDDPNDPGNTIPGVSSSPDGASSVIAWQTEALHDGNFQGIPRTGRTITLTGCTYVIGLDPEATDVPRDAVFVRFVDRASVLAQMGLTFNTKPLIDEDLLGGLSPP